MKEIKLILEVIVGVLTMIVVVCLSVTIHQANRCVARQYKQIVQLNAEVDSLSREVVRLRDIEQDWIVSKGWQQVYSNIED